MDSDYRDIHQIPQTASPCQSPGRPPAVVPCLTWPASLGGVFQGMYEGVAINPVGKVQ